MTVPTQRMELVLKQWPDFLVSHVAIHAQITTRIVDIVVMTQDAVLALVIEMRKRHRQNRLRAVVSVLAYRLLAERRAKMQPGLPN